MTRLTDHCRKSWADLSDIRNLCQGSTIILAMCVLSLAAIAVALLISSLSGAA